jgi:hypothetical protein
VRGERGHEHELDGLGDSRPIRLDPLDRGLLQPGMAADLVVFDPDTV